MEKVKSIKPEQETLLDKIKAAGINIVKTEVGKGMFDQNYKIPSQKEILLQVVSSSDFKDFMDFVNSNDKKYKEICFSILSYYDFAMALYEENSSYNRGIDAMTTDENSADNESFTEEEANEFKIKLRDEYLKLMSDMKFARRYLTLVKNGFNDVINSDEFASYYLNGNELLDILSDYKKYNNALSFVKKTYSKMLKNTTDLGKLFTPNVSSAYIKLPKTINI